MTEVTPAQIAILKARFPNIGEPVLRLNAAALLSRPLPGSPPPSPSAPVAPAKTAKQPAKERKPRASRVELTRNLGTISEAAYWRTIRYGLRRLFRFWRPAVAALHAARIPCKGAHGQKWAYVCADCRKLFPRKRVEIDHITPVGALTKYAHIADFVRRLTPEDPKAYAVRCLKCHQAKTNAERKRTVRQLSV